MDVSPDDARESLAQVGATTDAARVAAAYRGSDWLFIIWGLVWLLGYAGTPLWRHGMYVGAWWVTLLAAGGMASGLTYRRANPVRWASSARNVGWLWLVLWAFAYLWGALLVPFMHLPTNREWMFFYRNVALIAGTVAMCGYVIMGLWLESRLLLVLGLVVTALLLAGLLLPFLWFWFWAGAVAGGTLIGTGIVLLRRGGRHAGD